MFPLHVAKCFCLVIKESLQGTQPSPVPEIVLLPGGLVCQDDQFLVFSEANRLLSFFSQEEVAIDRVPKITP